MSVRVPRILPPRRGPEPEPYLAPEIARLVRTLGRAVHALTVEYGPLYTWADRRLIRSLQTQATGLDDLPPPMLRQAERLLLDAESVSPDDDRARFHREAELVHRITDTLAPERPAPTRRRGGRH
ncbi:MAG: hypothetical protein R2737_10755 [Candidatus Nanopelagicales bacterium]